MSGILRLESLTKGNTLKQGDKTPLKYRLFDADGEKLNIAGKSAKVRLVYPDFLTIGYEKDGLTVAQDDTVTFTIDSVVPSRIYHVEIIVDDKFIFPSRADEAKFTVDKSSLGTEANIIEIVGVDAVVRKAVDLINEDPSLIIDEDKLVGDIISNTGIGNINEYYQAFNDLKPKAEQAITKSAEALTKSQNALNVANGIDAKATNALSLSESADTLSKSVQEQFNQIVINGDSSVEAAQARVDASGQTNPTLKARLDKEHNEVTTQLAQTVPLLGQPDYVKLLHAHNQTDGKLKVKRTSPRNLDILIPLSNGKFQRHLLIKDPNDDFIKHGEISLVERESVGATEFKNYDSLQGAGWMTTSVNHFTRTVGETMTVSFTGTGIALCALRDDRGGMWEFVIDGGDPIYISTHINAATGQELGAGIYKTIITQDLPSGEHTMVATFKGKDPENPVDTPRGWVYWRSADQDFASFEVYKNVPTYNNKLLVGGSQSNKEFALGIKPKGAAYGAKFVPDHGDATAFPTYQKLSYDGVEKSLSETDSEYVEVNSVSLAQVVNGIHPNEPDNILCQIHIIHTANHDGMSCKVKVKFLQPSLCTGYVSMFPSQGNFAKKLLVSNGQVIEAVKIDGSTTDIVGGEFSKSYAYLNDISPDKMYKDTILAMTINDVNKTFRNGEIGRKEPNPVWIHHRTNNLQKLYPEVLSNTVMEPGDYIESDYTMYLGQLDFASDLLLP